MSPRRGYNHETRKKEGDISKEILRILNFVTHVIILRGQKYVFL